MYDGADAVRVSLLSQCMMERTLSVCPLLVCTRRYCSQSYTLHTGTVFVGLYLRDRPALTTVRAATLRYKMHIKFSISPCHRGLTVGQPVPELTLQRQAPGRDVKQPANGNRGQEQQPWRLWCARCILLLMLLWRWPVPCALS